MKKMLIISGFALLFFTNIVRAQFNSPNKQRDSSLVYITGEGTFINLGDPKGKGISVNLKTTLQPGFQYSRLDSTGGMSYTNRMSLNLARVALTAKGFNDKMSLGIVTDFTGTSALLEGWVGFSFFRNHAKLTMGERQTNTNNRLALADERYQQTLAQTIAGKSSDGIAYGGLMQNFVGSTREAGIFIETNFSWNKVRIYPSVSLTNGEGQGLYDTIGTKYKYGGRIDIMPLGDFIKNNAFIADDIYREQKPKLAIGIAGSYNVKAYNSIGNGASNVTGIYNKSGVQDYANYRKLIADFIFKYRGFSIVGEYINATVAGKNLYSNASSSSRLTPDIASVQYGIGNGYNFQTSYILKNGLSFSGRYSYITPESSNPASIIQKQNWYTFNINKYLKNNAVKIGLNTSYVNTQTPSVTTNKWISNLAFQFLF